jgi:hypothetical protein
MRKLLASTLAVGVLAGGVTAGAALASPDHPRAAKAAATAVSRHHESKRSTGDRSISRDRQSRDHTLSRLDRSPHDR